MLSCFAAIETEHREFYRLYNNRTMRIPNSQSCPGTLGHIYSLVLPQWERGRKDDTSTDQDYTCCLSTTAHAYGVCYQ